MWCSRLSAGSSAGADGAYVHAGEQGAGAEVGGEELGVAGFPDHRGGLFGERFVDAEVALEFEMRQW